MTSDPSYASPPSELESSVAQAASDIRVSAFGQRIRGALKRNAAAGEQTALREYDSRIAAGPDIVRHANALYLAQLDDEKWSNATITTNDRNLFSVLPTSLNSTSEIIATFWEGQRPEIARAFVDRDNIPIPLCPAYPDSRDAISNRARRMPRQLANAIAPIKSAIEQTQSWKSASECASAQDDNSVSELLSVKNEFFRQRQPLDGETLEGWYQRVSNNLNAARSTAPKPLLGLNQLVTACVCSMISIAIWGHEIDARIVAGCETRPFEGDLPDGFQITILEHFELWYTKMLSTFRVLDGSEFSGIGISHGSHLEFDSEKGFETRLSINRLSAYESLVE